MTSRIRLVQIGPASTAPPHSLICGNLGQLDSHLPQSSLLRNVALYPKHVAEHSLSTRAKQSSVVKNAAKKFYMQRYARYYIHPFHEPLICTLILPVICRVNQQRHSMPHKQAQNAHHHLEGQQSHC